MSSVRTITAAVLGELLPELEYAAPSLLERLERGEPLVAPSSPTDLGFETGAVDSVLLEFFKALVPYVKAVLDSGVLGLIQSWLLSEREGRRDAELIAGVNALIEENAKLRQSVARIAEIVGRREGTAVSTEEVVGLIAEATSRVSRSDGRGANDDD
jgi:hypothetical protein